MATTALKNSFANGKLCASTRRGNTRASLSRAMARWKFSVAEVPLSVAHTWTSNSRARKIELVALPHPSSRTRMPELNGRWRARLSTWHSAFSPNAFSRIQRSSYFAVRGKARSSTNEFTLDCVWSRWKREHDAIHIECWVVAEYPPSPDRLERPLPAKLLRLADSYSAPQLQPPSNHCLQA